MLQSWSKDSSTAEQLDAAEKEWRSLLDECAKEKEALEKEIAECALYQHGLQEVEKWLLQMSFQLMAQNSLYITNKAQTEEQIAQHGALLQEIFKYVHSFQIAIEVGSNCTSMYNMPSVYAATKKRLTM